MNKLPDIDIDLLNRDLALVHLEHKNASMIQHGMRIKHNTGIYVQDIPTDHMNIASIDYESAEKLGYFKLDLLNNSTYQGIDSIELRDQLINKEPNWDLLHIREIVENLPHISDHYNMVKKLNPRSIEQLAAVLSIIRPAKRYLQDETWDTILNEIWIKPLDNSYYWKKSHAIAYSVLVIMKLNYMEYQASINK